MFDLVLDGVGAVVVVHEGVGDFFLLLGILLSYFLAVHDLLYHGSLFLNGQGEFYNKLIGTRLPIEGLGVSCLYDEGSGVIGSIFKT